MTAPRSDRYYPLPDGGWGCLLCEAARRRRNRETAASWRDEWYPHQVDDPASHDQWHDTGAGRWAF